MIEEQKDPEHQEIVDSLVKSLVSLGIGKRRPHLVSNMFYHPDACVTVDGQKFVPIEVINSGYGFDILGMLSLVMCKDIIDVGVCIVTDRLYKANPMMFEKVVKQVNKFQKYSNQVYGNKLVILREQETLQWFGEQMKISGFWKPEDLEYAIN